MKIVTVNVQIEDIEAIKKLVGEDGIYPSRSELIRVAVREFLLKELNLAKKMKEYNLEEPEVEDFDEETYLKQLAREALNKKFEPKKQESKINPYLEEIARSKVGIF